MNLKRQFKKTGCCKIESQLSKAQYDYLRAKINYDSYLNYFIENDMKDTTQLFALESICCELQKKVNLLHSEFMTYSSSERFEATRVNNAFYKRKTRLNAKIKSILDNFSNAIFLTLTFNDLTLNSTNEETRKKYVQRYLKENCIVYVANVDYRLKKRS